MQLRNDYSVPDSLHAVDKLTLVSIVFFMTLKMTVHLRKLPIACIKEMLYIFTSLTQRSKL